MRKRSYGWVVLILSLLTGFSPAYAKTEADSASAASSQVAAVNPSDVIALGRSFLQLEQQKIVLANLQLTPQESEAFWPVYRAYQNDFEPLGDRLVKLIVRFSDKFESMTDEEALQMIKESQDIQQAETDLKKSYVEKFSKVLSPKKVLRLYQIDNKIRTEIRYRLSLEIPLLEVPEETKEA